MLVYTVTYPSPATCLTPVSSSPSDPISSDHDLLIALRKGKRQCTYPIASFVSYDHLSPSSFSFIASLDRVSIPKTIQEVLSHHGWRDAMIEEMNAWYLGFNELTDRKESYWLQMGVFCESQS